MPGAAKLRDVDQPDPPAWFEDERTRRLSAALLLALVLSIVIALASGSGADAAGGRLGGDYPAFYAAGRIAAAQGLDSVNDLDSLRDAQAGLFPGEDGFLTWAYPPHVALAYRPLAALPYRASYAVHTGLMVAAFVGAVALARPMLPWLRRGFLPAVALGLAYYPMFRGIGSGQNTALSLLLLAAAWRSSAGGRDGWAGFFLGLLLFKPQFAGIALGAWVAGGRWRVLPSFTAMAAGTWLLTAALAGTDWVGRYLDDLDAYRATEHVNASNHVSLGEMADALGLPTAVGGLLAVVVLGVVALRWWRARPGTGADLVGPMALLGPALLLAAAHSVFYDVGLVLVAAGALVQAGRSRAAALLWVAALVDPLKHALDLNPNGLLLVVWFVLAWRWLPAPRPVHATMAS